MNGNSSDSVSTVLGDITGDELGLTLVHEHVISDVRVLQSEAFDESRLAFREMPVDEVNPTLLRRDPTVCTDNCILRDEDTAVNELLAYRKAGGQSVVECSCIGLGRDAEALARVALASEVNIVAPTGYYLWRSVDEATRELSVRELARRMVADLSKGIGGTSVLAGFIGEVGTSAPLHAFEARVLKAAAHAYSETGKPINVHLDPSGQEAERVLEILLGGGVPAGRVIMGHVDLPAVANISYIRKIASAGVFLGLDTFGTTFEYDSDQATDPTDTARMILLKSLVDMGLEDQLVLSQDIAFKCQLLRYGGGGYAHLLTNLRPAIVSRGVPEEIVYKCLVQNPLRWLAPAAAAGG